MEKTVASLPMLVSTLALLLTPASMATARPAMQWISSTASQPWQVMPAPAISHGQSNAPSVIQIDPLSQYQSIDGFGACFNELGWDALQAVGPTQRAEAIKALFGAGGCHFTNCRVGMGANDFARGWYSFDETPNDFSMAHFSIDRDKTVLIPYLKLAMQDSPQLRIWGVPWSPPLWMKGHDGAGEINMDPRFLAAYGLYFSKYVQAYRREGINLYAVQLQNEPISGGDGYPKCRWNGPALNTFVRDYLVPQLKKDHVDIEVWLGSLNDDDISRFTEPVLDDPVTQPMITGVGYQYSGQLCFAATHTKYPGKKLMQTETECYDGDNTWSEALGTFGHVASDLNNFANSYDYWNMILNQKHTSSWGWRQNSLIILDSGTQSVIYNPDFYAMKHFAHFVRDGAHRIGIKGGDPKFCAAFQNPAGDIVVAFCNATPAPEQMTFQLGHSRAQLTVPAQSMNTAVLKGW